MTDQRTDARSSGVSIDSTRLKTLTTKRNGPAMVYLSATVALLSGTGYLLHLSPGTLWVIPAMLAYGSILTTSAYALSHEASHRTAFKSRWLNDVLFFVTSLVYVEEPNYRRFAHTRHHNYTWIQDKDAQIPREVPMSARGYLYEVSGVSQYVMQGRLLLGHALGLFSDEVRRFVPEAKLPKLKRGARVFLVIYASIAILISLGHFWLLLYLVIPRIVGAPFMIWITLIQHAEMQPDTVDIRHSTRSFKTNALIELIYWNMNHHIEHHLYPTVPFHALPALCEELGDQLPEPDPGALLRNIDVARAVFSRALRDPTAAQKNLPTPF